MIRIEKDDVFNLENAIRGMRNPLNSWSKIDSQTCCNDIAGEVCNPNACKFEKVHCYNLGENDMNLCKRLINAGTEHRKFMRQIMVSVDISAPLYWWKEFDTYKIGTTANSCSTMHKLHTKSIELNDFSVDQLTPHGLKVMEGLIDELESLRKSYIENNNKETWYTLIQLLPTSYNQLRTVTLNYEVLLNMYHQRKNHKLQEWRDFCKWLFDLPYMQDFIASSN